MFGLSKTMRLALTIGLIVVGVIFTPQSTQAATLCPHQQGVTAINAKASANAAFLGAYIDGPFVTGRGDGCFAHYQNAVILWSTGTPASMVYGLIYAKWAELQFENGPMGYPNSDELDTINRDGRYAAFQGGMILWKRGAKEAFAIYGKIYSAFAKNGRESRFGYPVSDEIDWGRSSLIGGTARASFFEHAVIMWLPKYKGSDRTVWISEDYYTCWVQLYQPDSHKFRWAYRYIEATRTYDFVDSPSIAVTGSGKNLKCSTPVRFD